MEIICVGSSETGIGLAAWAEAVANSECVWSHASDVQELSVELEMSREGPMEARSSPSMSLPVRSKITI